MFGLPANLAEYPIAIILLLIFMAIVGFMLNREDKKGGEQNRVNEEFLKTLLAMQNNLNNNWQKTQEVEKMSQESLITLRDVSKVTQESLSMVRDVAKILSNIKCLK